MGASLAVQSMLVAHARTKFGAATAIRPNVHVVAPWYIAMDNSDSRPESTRDGAGRS
jgi:hypothetical protein